MCERHKYDAGIRIITRAHPRAPGWFRAFAEGSGRLGSGCEKKEKEKKKEREKEKEWGRGRWRETIPGCIKRIRWLMHFLFMFPMNGGPRMMTEFPN